MLFSPNYNFYSPFQLNDKRKQIYNPDFLEKTGLTQSATVKVTVFKKIT